MPRKQPLQKNQSTMARSMYIGLAVGVIAGAVVSQVEFGNWWLGAIVGSGLGPLFGMAIDNRFGNSIK